VTPDSLHDTFFAAASAAGALIGLLFVAISVEHDRITAEDADQAARIRARGALAAFTTSLSVSLWALTPGRGLAISATAVGVPGLLFVLGSLLSVRRVARDTGDGLARLRTVTFLLGQFVVYALQILSGIRLIVHPHDTGAAGDIADLVIVSILIGIYRSWELIGGPDIGFGRELRLLVRGRARRDETDG
jgi:hypothetical protein